MITARQAVLAEAATYDDSTKPTVSALNGSIAVFITEIAGDVLVAVEGTHDAIGWGVDFNAWLTFLKPIDGHPALPPAHKGFTDAVDAIIDDVRKAVTGKPWHAIGHSLGGGVVLELAARLTDEGNPPAAVWLFAPARVFLDAPDVLADVPIHAWRCGGDLVPMVPPWCWRPIMTHLPGPADESSHHITNFTDQIK